MCALGRRSLCLFWHETQTKGLSSRSPARPEEDEEKKVPERTEGELTKEPRESSGQRWAEETSRLIEQLCEGGRRRWKQDREKRQQKSERRLLRPDDLHRGRVNQREKISAFFVTFVEVSRKIHVHDSLQMHGECKVSQNTLSCAWSWHKSILFVCSSFYPLGCIFVAVKKCEIPGGNH